MPQSKAETAAITTVIGHQQNTRHFIFSMKNRRIYDEVLRMKDKYPYSYVLVYGDWKGLIPKFYKYTIAQKCSSVFKITAIYKVPVFWVATTKEFLTMINEMSRNIDKVNEPIEPPIIRDKNSNPFVNVLIGINGVGEKTALKLLSYFKTPGGVFNASEDELKEVPRLSKKIINEILRMKDSKEKK